MVNKWSNEQDRQIAQKLIKIQKRLCNVIKYQLKYYNKRTKAIEILSTVLWGFTSKDCMPIIEQFL